MTEVQIPLVYPTTTARSNMALLVQSDVFQAAQCNSYTDDQIDELLEQACRPDGPILLEFDDFQDLSPNFLERLK